MLIKKGGLLFFGLMFLILAVLLISLSPLSAKIFAPTPDHLKLKTSKENIIQGETINEKGEEIVAYFYKTDKVVKETVFTGNDPNAQYSSALLLDNEIIEGEKRGMVRFFTKEHFYKDGDEWKEIEFGTTTKEAWGRQTTGFFSRLFGRSAYAAISTSTFSADGDGWAQYNCNPCSWATARGAITGNTAGYTNAFYYMEASDYGSGNNYIIRNFFVFNSGLLDDSAVISSSTFYIYYAGEKVDSAGVNPADVALVEGTQASVTEITTADYDQVGNTKWSNKIIDLGAIGAGYHALPLNNTGTSSISVTDWTKMAVKGNNDFSDVTAPNGVSYSKWYQANEIGTSKDPYLEIEYTLPHTPPATAMRARKNIDQTATSTTILIYDDELKVSLSSANTLYIIDGLILATAESASSDIKIGFDAPDRASIDIAYIAYKSRDVGVIKASSTASAKIDLKKAKKKKKKKNLTNDNEEIIQISGTVKTGDTTGTLYFMWAQNKSRAQATIVKKGSYLRSD